MSVTNTIFQKEQAPCGQVVDGEHFVDEDEDALVSDEMHYACGCRVIRHEYHDGTLCRKVIRHDGKHLVDELLAER